jgi:hypothetical protein
MNRLIIPTSDATYGDLYLSKDEIMTIIRSSNNIINIHPKSHGSVSLTLAVSEVGSSASYNAFIEACYDAKPGGDITVVLPKGQSITTVNYD